MTVASEAYSALRAWTGAETSFAAGFSAAAASDVKVYSRDAAGTDTLLSQGSHYGLTLAGDGSVTILPINLPPPPVTLVIVRDTPATQSTDFEDLETFSADDHERLHDARARTDGELKGAFARALRFPFGELAPMLPTSLLRKAGGIGSVLGFRGDTGEPVLVSPDAPIAPAAPIDYQEANWSPVIEGDATPGLQTYATQFGRYVRVGNMVTVTALIVMSAKDGATAGNIQIGGLPFISRNVAALRGAADIGFTQNWDLDVAGGFYTLSGLILNNSTKIQMWQGGDNVVGKRVVAANIGNATAIQLNATYFIGTEIISEGNDTFTKALLHFDGAKFTTAIVDSNAGGSPHVWTAVGNAQIDTLQSVFGGASLLLDGTGDYVTTPAHADFNLGSGDFTIEGRFRCISTTARRAALSARATPRPRPRGSASPSIGCPPTRSSGRCRTEPRLRRSPARRSSPTRSISASITSPSCAPATCSNCLSTACRRGGDIAFTGTIPNAVTPLTVGRRGFLARYGRTTRRRMILTIILKCGLCSSVMGIQRNMAIAEHRFDNAKRRRPEHHARQAMLTPSYVLEPVRQLLGGIGLDPCTEPNNPTGADQFYHVPQDGCALPWNAASVFCNPPYGEARDRWVMRCIGEGPHRKVVLLIPSATETKIFQKALAACVSVVFVRARLRFGVLRENRRQEAASHGSAIFGFGVCVAPLGDLGAAMCACDSSAQVAVAATNRE